MVTLLVREHVADGCQDERQDRRRAVHAALRDDGEDRHLDGAGDDHAHRHGFLGGSRAAAHPREEGRRNGHVVTAGSRVSATSSGVPWRHG